MGTYRKTISAGTLIGDKVVNGTGEKLGKVEELMIDIENGGVAYAVLSFGGFLGMGDKLFAMPWNKVTVDETNHQLVVDVPKERLEKAPGFDKDHWPDFSNLDQRATIDRYYA